MRFGALGRKRKPGSRSAVERELILQLASLLWRLRRATMMETGLFEIQAEHLRDYRQSRQLLPQPRDVIHAVLRPVDAATARADPYKAMTNLHTAPELAMKADPPAVEFTRCWRQAKQILYALEVLDRRKPQERNRHLRFNTNRYERHKF
jgi:hypothetical protein